MIYIYITENHMIYILHKLQLLKSIHFRLIIEIYIINLNKNQSKVYKERCLYLAT